MDLDLDLLVLIEHSPPLRESAFFYEWCTRGTVQTPISGCELPLTVWAEPWPLRVILVSTLYPLRQRD